VGVGVDMKYRDEEGRAEPDEGVFGTNVSEVT
jgi:hypothetical protein